MEKSIKLALETWYKTDVPHDEQVNQAVLQLCSEVGELMRTDDVQDELGDAWYYIRILAHLFDLQLEHNDICQYEGSIDLMIIASQISGNWAKHLYKPNREINKFWLSTVLSNAYSLILNECEWLGITIDELTQSNYKKLKGGHGWNGADKKIHKRNMKIAQKYNKAALDMWKMTNDNIT